MSLSEKELKDFSNQRKKKNTRTALIEGVVAFLPMIALFIGFTIVSRQPQPAELFAPSRAGIVAYLFPLLIIAYFIFLYFIVNDIYKKVKD